MYRLSLNNLHGTAENPIVVTIDASEQIQWNFRSYYGITFWNCTHLIFDGKGYNNLDYGIHVTKYESTSTAISGIAIGYICSDIEIFGIESSNATFNGLTAKTDPDKDRPETWRGNYSFNNLLIHHNYFHDSSAEGNYLGYFSPENHTTINSSGDTVTYRAHELNSAKIYRNNYYRCGWDSLQLNNGTNNCEICYNTILDSSIYPQQDQSTFMSLSLDGMVYNNTMINCGGLGIQFGTFSGISIFNNMMTGIAIGSSALLLISSINVPEQYGSNGINNTTIINVYNNTMLCDGNIMFNAQNVVQFNQVYIKNNLTKYKSVLFGGQATETLANWETNSESNYRILDDGSTYQIANIDDNNLQISSNSILATSGVIFGENFDLRGYENWNIDNKYVGAYSGYRKVSDLLITLNTFLINNGNTVTNNKLVAISYTYIGTPTKYMISEDSTFSGASWITINGDITYTLSEPDGDKIVYFKIGNIYDVVSSTLNYTIKLNRVNRILIDIGSSNITYQTGLNGAPSTTGITWNNLYSIGNITPIATGNTVTPLVNTIGNSQSFSIVVSSVFSQYETNGGVQNSASTYPYTAYRDSFNAISGTYGELKLYNLNSSNTYSIKCFGARGFVNNRTIYTVNGNSQPLLTKDNIHLTANFNNVIPINNEIIIRVEGDITYNDPSGYISVLDIIENIVSVFTTTTTTMPVTTTTTTIPVTTTTTTIPVTTTTTTIPVTTTTTTTTTVITTSTTTTTPVTTTTTTTPVITTTTTTNQSQKTFLIDFGVTDNGYITSNPVIDGAYWNNFASGTTLTPYTFSSGDTLSNLIDTSSVTSTLSIQLTSNNWTTNQIGGGNIDISGSSYSGYIYPYTSVRDSFNVANPFTGTTRIIGCDYTKYYTIGILSSRYSEAINVFTIQGISKSINPNGVFPGNSGTTIWYNIVSVGGVIDISAYQSTTSSFVWLELMDITETSSPVDLPLDTTINLVVNDSPYSASISVSGQDDWYHFTTSLSGSYTMRTYGTTDLYMQLYADDMTTLIAQDDDSGGSRQPLITQTLLSSTKYYLKVYYYNHTGTGLYTIAVIY